MIEKFSAKSRVRALLAALMILIAFEPFSPTSPVSADSFAAVFAYNPTTIKQEVSVSDINSTSQFTMTASVAKSWASDYVYIEAVFKDSAGNTLTSVRNPSSGSTTLTSDSPIEMSVSLASTDAGWSTSIAKVEAIVWGDDGEYWAGNYGVALDWVKLEQTTSTGTSQLLLNPEFANGNAHWTSSAGWQQCSGGAGAAVCVTNTFTPSTSSPTTSVAPATSSTSSTTSTTTTTTVVSTTSSTSTTTTPAAATTTPTATTEPAPTISTTTAAPVAQAAIPRVSTTVAGTLATNPTSTTTTTTTTTTTIPQSPNVEPGESSLSVNGEPVATTLERKNNQLIISSERMNAVISGRREDGTPAVLDPDGNIRLETGDQLITEVSGFNPDSDVAVWVFSNPIKLGSVTVASTGKATSTFTVPASVESGRHGVVLSGVNPLGERANFSVGIIIGSEGGVGTVGKILIAVPVLLAGVAALTIPARRKRRNSAAPA
jgi:hypothetical protein